MSTETVFKLLTENSFSKAAEETEPFTIFETLSTSTNSTSYNKPAEYKLDDEEPLPSELKERFDFQNLAFKPLEEIDPEYCRKQTFVAVGTDSTVRRFSGRRSPFILNPLKPLRRVGIYLLSHWHLPVLIGISLCLLCLSTVLPNYPYISTRTFIRYLVSLVLSAEICVNVLARGVLVDEFTYLRNPWHWLDVLIWAIIFLGNLLDNSILHSFQGVVFLKFIPLVPALRRNAFRSTVKTFKNVLPAFIYSLTILWILLVFGLHLQRSENEKSSTNCQGNDSLVVNSEDINLKNLTSVPIGNNTISIPANSLFDCANDTETIVSLYAIFLRSLELVTLKAFGGLPLEINPLNQNFNYVLFTLVFGTLGIGVLTTASVLDAFLDDASSKTYRNRSGDLKFFKKLLPQIQASNCDCSALNTLNNNLYHPFFEILVTSVISFDIILAVLTVCLEESSESQKLLIRHVQQACLAFYVIEFGLKILTGPIRYVRNKWSWLDIFVVWIYALDKSGVWYRLTWVLLIRLFKITPRWPKLYSMFAILVSTFLNRFQMIFVLWTFVFAYLIGIRQLIPENEEARFPRFVYLFNNWDSTFQSCKLGLGPNPCALILPLELFISLLFVTVILASVIHITYESLRKPSEPPENFRNLIKGINLIKSVFRQKCRSSSSDSRQFDFIETPTPRVEVISSNGGTRLQKPSGLPCNHEPIPVGEESVENPESAEKYHAIFQWISLGMILIGTVATIIDLGGSGFSNPRLWIDIAFILYFVVTWIWKLFAQGWQTMRNPRWAFDFLIVSASGITCLMAVYQSSESNNTPVMKTIAALSCCKGMMLISRIEWARVAAIGLVYELHALWGYLLVTAFLYVYFLNLKIELPVEIQSYLSGTGLNGTLSSISHQNHAVSFLLPFLTLVGGICIGVIFYQLMRNNMLYSFMTTCQQTVYKEKSKRIRQEAITVIPYPKRKVCMQVIHYVTLTNAFDLTLLGFIVCDCLIITLSPFSTSKDWKIIWSFYPYFIVSLYLFEMVVKLLGWRKYYFKSKWNIFDCLVLAVNIVDVLLINVQFGIVTAKLVRFLRILRVFQVKPLLRKTKLLQIFYTALLRISPTLWNLLLLYLIFLYSYATVWVGNLRSSPQELIEAFQLFKRIVVSLILMPFYLDSYRSSFGTLMETNSIAQTPSCWKGQDGWLWGFYLNSYLVICYLIASNFYAIYVYEILKEVDKDFNYSTCSNPSKNEDDDDNNVCFKYKHTNGMLLAVQSPDDIISMETMLTPTDNNTNVVGEESEPFKAPEETRYPMQISANGYIIHVEATVSTV